MTTAEALRHLADMIEEQDAGKQLIFEEYGTLKEGAYEYKITNHSDLNSIVSALKHDKVMIYVKQEEGK